MVELAPGWTLIGPSGERCPHCHEFLATPLWSLSGPGGELPLVNGTVRTQAAAEKFARQVLEARGVL